MVKILKTDCTPLLVLRKPLKRNNTLIKSSNNKSDKDRGSILLRRRNTRAGRLTRDH